MSDRHLNSPLGVCVFPEPLPNAARTSVSPHYIHEILAHAGVCYRTVTLDELPGALPGLGLLLTVGESKVSETLQSALADWVKQGGGWVSIAGICGQQELLGAEYAPASYVGFGGSLFSGLGAGYLKREAAGHAILDHIDAPLHFFSGIAVKANGARVLARGLDAHQRAETERPLILENTVGAGRSILIAPDVTGTVVRIQQGTCITRDGIPAPDGTAPVDDRVLKTDDGMALDWDFDRSPLPDTPSLKAFLTPIADCWREIVLKSIFHLATQLGVTLPLLWLYPNNISALGHISHDTDGSDPKLGRALLDTMAQAEINSTWCVILPGYAPDLIDAIRQAGHELATHYDAMSPGMEWGEEQFDDQLKQLSTMFGPDAPITNKNHYLRWEGDTEFFTWCVKRGLRLDQSKGPSKSGGAGFIFGTCHPYFPVTSRGEPLDIVELPTHTQDLIVFAPEGLATCLISAAERHHGVAHLLFHPAHIAKPGVADSILNCVRLGKERGLTWWTGRQINDWERARREISWSGYASGDGRAAVKLAAGEALTGATLLLLAPAPLAVKLDGQAREPKAVKRWGFEFLAVIVDLGAGSECEIEVESR